MLQEEGGELQSAQYMESNIHWHTHSHTFPPHSSHCFSQWFFTFFVSPYHWGTKPIFFRERLYSIHNDFKISFMNKSIFSFPYILCFKNILPLNVTCLFVTPAFSLWISSVVFRQLLLQLLSTILYQSLHLFRQFMKVQNSTYTLKSISVISTASLKWSQLLIPNLFFTSPIKLG